MPIQTGSGRTIHYISLKSYAINIIGYSFLITPPRSSFSIEASWTESRSLIVVRNNGVMRQTDEYSTNHFCEVRKSSFGKSKPAAICKKSHDPFLYLIEDDVLLIEPLLPSI